MQEGLTFEVSLKAPRWVRVVQFLLEAGLCLGVVGDEVAGRVFRRVIERGCRWRIGEGEWWRLEDYAGVRVE